MTTVTIDTGELDRFLADFPEALARAQKRALEGIGAEAASLAGRAFRSESLRPEPWAPRKPSKHDDGHPLLIRSGALRQSVGWRLEGAGAVAVGSDREYAAYHQFGTKNMPARPFLPFDRDGNPAPRFMRKIQRRVQEAYEDEIRKIFGNGGG